MRLIPLMEFSSVEDYVLFNPDDAPLDYSPHYTLPWIPAEYPMHRRNFLETLRRLGIYSISKENRNSGSNSYYSFTLPKGEKLQIYENLLSLFESYQDYEVVSKERFSDTLGWYLVWPTPKEEEGTPLKTLMEQSRGPDSFYGSATPSLMYLYRTGRAILINPYLESLDINRLEEALESSETYVFDDLLHDNLEEIFINPRYEFSYIEDYSTVYLGFTLSPRVFKRTLNYPQAQY